MVIQFNIELSIVNPNEHERIQIILDEAPTYHMNTEGIHPIPNAGRETLTALPEGFNGKLKHVLVLTLHGEDIGVVDLLENFPEKGTAFLGLLLLKESHQGKGLGRLCFLEVQKYIMSLDCQRIRIAVVDSNPVEPFWEKMGFQRTG